MSEDNDYLLKPKDFPLGFFNKVPDIEEPQFEEFTIEVNYDTDLNRTTEKKVSGPQQRFFSKNRNIGTPFKNQTTIQKGADEQDPNDFLKIYDIEPQKENAAAMQTNLEEDLKKYKLEQDQEALVRIIQALEPVIDRGIQIFGNGNQALRGQAKILVKNAIDSYDPAKGELKTHVLLHLQRLRRIQPQSGNIITVSEGMKILIAQLTDAEKELTDKLGRPPSDQELADYMNISLEKLKKIRTAQGSAAESNVEGLAIESPTEENDKEQARELWIQAIYVDLDPTEQYILDSVYGRNGRQKKTLQQIAEDLKLPLSTVHAKLKKIENIINLTENI